MSCFSPRHLFQDCFERAVQAALPDAALASVLPSPPKGRLCLVGAGKGVAQLAAAFETAYPGPLDGLVVTRYGFGQPCKRVRVLEAAHPVPDQASYTGAQALMQMVQGLTPDDLVVALFTGGGSALLASPLAPMTLDDEISLNQALLACGAPIGEMNIIRRHLSAIKGGRLAAAAQPAQLVTYVVSDVPGDDPAEVASGPTVAGSSSPQDALELIRQYDLPLSTRVFEALGRPEAICPQLGASPVHILASASKSLSAVVQHAKTLGIEVINLGDAIEGEARSVAEQHALIVRQKQAQGWSGLLVSGGETSVTLSKRGGKGGRNTEYLLALSIALAGEKDVAFFAADTDGIDGSEDNAGAFADGNSFARLQAQGLSPQALLDGHDAYTAFAALGDLFVPGPTGTNVNDLRLIYIA